MSLLAAAGIDAFYGDVQALWDVSFEVGEGEAVTLIGSNGAGKSTLLKAVAGLLVPARGRIVFDGQDVAGEPTYRLVERGLVLIPEARQLWPAMTVRENLEMGAYGRAARPLRAKTLESVFAMFPILEQRARQNAGTLSGGEQQMCAIGRGLMARPRLLLLDEPALGLAPIIVEQVFQVIRQLHSTGITILLVEQNLKKALEVADRGYVVETGKIKIAGSSAELSGNEAIRAAYLGL